MGIPLYIFLIFYLLLAGVFLLYGLFSLYHIIRFAHLDAASYFMTGIFIAGIVLIGFVSFTFIIGIDWTQSIELFSLTSNAPGIGL